MKRFADKVSVITGAGSGIGRALSVELARRGARLALSDVDLVSVAETAALCEKEGADVRHYQLDVADRAAVYGHAEAVAGVRIVDRVRIIRIVAGAAELLAERRRLFLVDHRRINARRYISILTEPERRHCAGI